MIKKKVEKINYDKLRKHPAYQYAKDIVEGKIVSGKYVKKECQRFLDMVDNHESRFYQLYFVDLKIVDFIDVVVSLTNFATGEFAGKSCKPYIAGFQWYILVNIYAVKLRKNPKKRRFEKACVFIARRHFCGFY